MRRGPDVVGLCECERSGTAADETRVPEPSAAAQEYGGAAAAAPQPPAAGQPPEARPEIVAYDLDWEPAVGRRCEARYLASKASKLQLWQCHWHPGVVTAVAKDARPPYCSVKYDDGDAESRVRFEFVRKEEEPPPPPPPAHGSGAAPARAASPSAASDSVAPAMAPAAGVKRGALAGGDKGEGRRQVPPLEESRRQSQILNLSSLCLSSCDNSHSSAVSSAGAAAKGKGHQRARGSRNMARLVWHNWSRGRHKKMCFEMFLLKSVRHGG